VYASLGLRLSLTLVATALLCGEQLPVKTYTTADGLSRNGVHLIVQDAHGFLWLSTSDGLARFDGYTFINYGPEQGLPNRYVTSLEITKDGAYWVGTTVGLFRLDSNSPAPQKFEAVRVGTSEHARYIEAMLTDRSGTLWVGTQDGVYRLVAGSKSGFEAVDVGITKRVDGTRVAGKLMEDRQGTLWVSNGELHRRTRDGRLAAYRDDRFKLGISTMLEDRQGRQWVGLTNGLCRLNPNAGPNDPIVTRVYTTRDGLPGNRVGTLLETSDGRLWAGAEGGIGVYIEGTDRFESYTVANGLSDQSVETLAEDRDGNLWVGTNSGGLMRIALQGFKSYTTADGLTGILVASILTDNAGELCAQTIGSGWRRALNCLAGKRFKSIRPRYPEKIRYFGWGWNQTVMQDHTGEWWIPTGQGLCRFGRAERPEQLAGREPKAVYTAEDGLPGNDIFRLFEDSRGDIWISTVGQAHDPLTRWERATGRFHVFSEADGLPRIQSSATAFAEDRFGQVWIGLFGGGLMCFRNGRFHIYSESDGAPAGQIGSLYLDGKGRLWIGSSNGGLARIDNPGSAHPHLAVYTTAQGLSSNAVRCITEDLWGRIYACTGRGVDRLDPASGHVRHYTAADGLTRGEMNAARRDRQGALWFGSRLGLSRFEPKPDRPDSPPPVRITGLQVRGVSQPMAILGEMNLPRLVLGPNQNQLRLDFTGLGFAPGELLRYQYWLEGADHDWNAPTEQRSVNYASLSPGSYTFRVRAVSSGGSVSAEPAVVIFRILSPVWHRWWFLSAAGVALSLLIYALYRYRVAQLLAVERVRIRIATDLHDDIGSSLSQIAILSEVARQKIENADSQAVGPLSDIAMVSGELVDAMSDIVWSINPKHDHFSDLEHRMRRFATDVLTACSIGLEFRVTVTQQDLRIGTDIRRQVFLIFKEAVNNIARHSGATLATVEFSVAQEHLVLQVTDNGTGFDAADGGDGNGLVNMRKRASDLGGTAVFKSLSGRGTNIALRVPLTYQHWWGQRIRK
jgi:ligand-binding sensor domain-containing protein/signal transduction histidine kinase